MLFNCCCYEVIYLRGKTLEKGVGPALRGDARRVKLPWVGCCFAELFVLRSIVVCTGCTAICHCQRPVPYLSIAGLVKPLDVGEGGKLEMAVVTWWQVEYM